ncbi:MAG: N-acetyltransferase [Endomicrobiales bacterium]|jgi:predicted N-acetyltransferase YhbS
MKIDIRPELESDYTAIYQVVDKAFGKNTEAVRIDTLRKTPGFVAGLSLTGKHCGKLVGHILFYPVDIVDGDKKSKTLLLGPVSVLPAYQKKGIGGKLIKVGLSKAVKSGFASVIVVGDPLYFVRFGFKPASTWNIRVPGEHSDTTVCALELTAGALSASAGIVNYPSLIKHV